VVLDATLVGALPEFVGGETDDDQSYEQDAQQIDDEFKFACHAVARF
jgi:hypothetical protein